MGENAADFRSRLAFDPGGMNGGFEFSALCRGIVVG